MPHQNVLLLWEQKKKGLFPKSEGLRALNKQTFCQSQKWLRAYNIQHPTSIITSYYIQYPLCIDQEIFSRSTVKLDY